VNSVENGVRTKHISENEKAGEIFDE